MSSRIPVWQSLAALAAACGVAATAHSAGDAEKCLAAKIKAVSKYESCLYKAEAVAVIKEITPDSSKCESKYSESWQKAEDNYGLDCPTNGDEIPVHDDSAEHVDIKVATLKNEAPVCGNNEIDAGEECDGTELGGETCVTQGYPNGGVLACSGCTFDISDCDECDILAQTGCGVGEGCYPLNQNQICAGAGSSTEGQACMFANSCVPGLACVNNPTPVCSTICDSGDNMPGCDGAETCVNVPEWGPTYGFCQFP